MLDVLIKKDIVLSDKMLAKKDGTCHLQVQNMHNKRANKCLLKYLHISVLLPERLALRLHLRPLYVSISVSRMPSIYCLSRVDRLRVLLLRQAKAFSSKHHLAKYFLSIIIHQFPQYAQ